MIRHGIQFILALAAWNCLAQIPGWSPVELSRVQRVAEIGGGGGGFYYPTNLPAQAAYTWHVWEDYTTNSGMGTWPDRIGDLDATNTAGSGTPVEGPALNSKRTGYFDGSTKVLFAQPFDTGPQPYSFHFVLALTNHSSGVAGFAGSTNNSGNTYAGYVGVSGSSQFRAGATSASPGLFNTNKWMSIVYIWNGASSQVWTNGVQLGANATVAAGDFEGLEFGRLANSSSFDGKFTVAEFSTYQAALTSANISNLFSYSTNTYAFGY